jgi:glycine/D-amino acid oxidase-like deaminating enzyme
MKSLYEFDIVIVGGGCVGSSIFSELSLRGFQNVALIDYGRTTLSATAVSGGFLRQFHENPEHTKLAIAGFKRIQQYRNMGILRGLYLKSGHLYFFNQDRFRSFEKSISLMRESNIDFQVLPTGLGQQMFPKFKWDVGDWAIFEPQAGQYDPPMFVNELMQYGASAGNEVIENFQVQRICPYSGQYRLLGEGKTINAKSIILAGGARMRPLMNQLGINSNFYVKELRVFKSKQAMACNQMPNYFNRENLQFGGHIASGKFLTSSLTDEKIIYNSRQCQESFELDSADDMYTPGRNGLLGQVPGQSRFFIATGWGGTAFKFSLEIGNRIAKIVERDFIERRMFYEKFV